MGPRIRPAPTTCTEASLPVIIGQMVVCGGAVMEVCIKLVHAPTYLTLTYWR
jgi:hypothetical protein